MLKYPGTSLRPLGKVKTPSRPPEPITLLDLPLRPRPRPRTHGSLAPEHTLSPPSVPRHVLFDSSRPAGKLTLPLQDLWLLTLRSPLVST